VVGETTTTREKGGKKGRVAWKGPERPTPSPWTGNFVDSPRPKERQGPDHSNTRKRGQKRTREKKKTGSFIQTREDGITLSARRPDGEGKKLEEEKEVGRRRKEGTLTAVPNVIVQQFGKGV